MTVQRRSAVHAKYFREGSVIPAEELPLFLTNLGCAVSQQLTSSAGSMMPPRSFNLGLVPPPSAENAAGCGGGNGQGRKDRGKGLFPSGISLSRIASPSE